MKNSYSSLLFTTVCLIFLWFTPSHAQIPPQHKEQTAQIDSFITSTIDSKYSASVLVSVDGKILLEKGYGWTDSTKRYLTTEKTLFNIASITKSFTATGIFILNQAGRVRLQDSLPKFFSHVPSDKQGITIQQLLLHTSGLRQSYASDGIADRDSAVTAILNDSLKFFPGTDFSYSNLNYELLGAIIEKVSGNSYEEFVRNNIHRKANMNDTKFWSEGFNLEANNVASMNRELDSSVLKRNWGYIGSAGIYTTVSDLNRWFTALMDGKVLDSSSLALMWKPQKQLTTTGIASGWYVSTTDGMMELWTRGTEDWGHNAVLRWFEDSKTLVIVLTNSGELGDKSVTGNRIISDGIVKILFEK